MEIQMGDAAMPMQRMELIGGESIFPNMPPDNQPGGLTLSERLTRIENGQDRLQELLHHIELVGSQKAQDAMAEVLKLEVRTEHLERDQITAEAVKSAMTSAANEVRATRRWLIGTVIAVITLTAVVVFNLLTVHKISFG